MLKPRGPNFRRSMTMAWNRQRAKTSRRNGRALGWSELNRSATSVTWLEYARRRLACQHIHRASETCELACPHEPHKWNFYPKKKSVRLRYGFHVGNLIEPACIQRELSEGMCTATKNSGVILADKDVYLRTLRWNCRRWYVHYIWVMLRGFRVTSTHVLTVWNIYAHVSNMAKFIKISNLLKNHLSSWQKKQQKKRVQPSFLWKPRVLWCELKYCPQAHLMKNSKSKFAFITSMKNYSVCETRVNRGANVPWN